MKRTPRGLTDVFEKNYLAHTTGCHSCAAVDTGDRSKRRCALGRDLVGRAEAARVRRAGRDFYTVERYAALLRNAWLNPSSDEAQKAVSNFSRKHGVTLRPYWECWQEKTTEWVTAALDPSLDNREDV